jgi:hypothetical protein
MNIFPNSKTPSYLLVVLVDATPAGEPRRTAGQQDADDPRLKRRSRLASLLLLLLLMLLLLQLPAAAALESRYDSRLASVSHINAFA